MLIPPPAASTHRDRAELRSAERICDKVLTHLRKIVDAPSSFEANRGQTFGRYPRMRWLCIDATAPDHLVVYFTHGLDLHVHRHVAELVERRTGRLVVAWQLARA